MMHVRRVLSPVFELLPSTRLLPKGRLGRHLAFVRRKIRYPGIIRCSNQYFSMSRGIKDLRELINISRLSFHGDNEREYLSDTDTDSDENEVLSKTTCHNKHKNTSPRPKLSVSEDKPCATDEHVATKDIKSRFKPLPAIKTTTMTLTAPTKMSTTVAKQNPTKIEQEIVSCEKVLKHIETDVVKSWLVRANDTINLLNNWISTESNFVKFAHFWLSDITKTKQRELIQLEFEIIIEEITFALKTGIEQKLVTQEDIILFLQVVVWEYPGKLCGKNICKFLLNTLLTLASGKKEAYRHLLSNVKSFSKKQEHIHWILSARSFALISVVASVLNFYLSLSGHDLLQITGRTNERKNDNVNCLLLLDAVRLGYKDVLQYFIKEQNMDISCVKNENGLPVLFVAVSSGHEDVVDFILKVSSDIDTNQVSSSGNTLLHVAVNTGNAKLVQLLLTAGADVNQVNVECGNATPLHLAVMQGECELVSILLKAGAYIHGPTTESSSTCSPLKLAQDLNMVELVEIMIGENVSS